MRISMKYALAELQNILPSAEIIGNEKACIQLLYFDTRLITNTENACFVALKTPSGDGHEHIPEAIKKGIKIFITEKKIPHENIHQIIVEDSFQAIQIWATFHRNRFDIPVIAITGSNGKTMVKEWLYQLLWDDYKIARSPKSYNSQVGVPLSLLQINEETEIAIIEAGISLPGEMEKLQAIIQPTIAVLTNVGDAHRANFESNTQHIQEKIKLFAKAKVLVFSSDDENIVEKIDSLYPNRKNILFGSAENANIRLQRFENQLKIWINDQSYELISAFQDEASLQNIMTCLAIIDALALDVQSYLPKIQLLQPIEMRLEIKNANYNSIVINDVYNSDLESIKIALDLLIQQTRKYKSLILTDLFQIDLNEADLYQKTADLVNQYPLDEVILIGDKIGKYNSLFKAFKQKYKTTEGFIRGFKSFDYQDKAILLKGARNYHLENISSLLEAKSHDTVLEVNLSAMARNIQYFRSHLKLDTKIMVMVKAFSYGTGSVEIADMLSFLNIDYLGVAYSDEGIALRNAGITLPIMVMNPEQNSYEDVINGKMEPEIYSIRTLHLFLEKLKYKAVSTSYNIHLKLNTGMNRLGLDANQLDELLEILNKNQQLKVKSIFTHLAVAENEDEKEFTEQQFHRFQEMYQYLSERLGYQPLRHALNTEGCFHYPEYQMDMVRLGIGVYGYASSPALKEKLQPAITFKTTISQIRNLKEGESISYGRKYFTKGEERIATLPVGYADGIPRMISNKGWVMIHGQRAPMVGTICMDMLMVNVTNIDCKEGDEVILFGETIDLDTFASWSDTINYEALTSISPRVKRIYFRET